MKKTICKLLAILATLALLFTTFSFVIVAENDLSDSINTTTPDRLIEPLTSDEETSISTEPESIEILSRRERNVKHFRHEDGTVEAIVYGYAVHRQDETGVWQDIDNRLTDYAEGNTVYYVTDDARIRFSNSGIGQLTMTLNTKPYRITMGMLTDGLRTGKIDVDSNATPEIVVRNHMAREE